MAEWMIREDTQASFLTSAWFMDSVLKGELNPFALFFNIVSWEDKEKFKSQNQF